jgi:N-acetylglutamate synthase-like GNAT family acetyltransferase
VITIAPANDLNVVRELLTEYASSLHVDLSFQEIDRELATLGQFYQRILVAYEGSLAAGCVALRHLDDATCEMKRLYVRPEFRGRTSVAASRSASSKKRGNAATHACDSTRCRR